MKKQLSIVLLLQLIFPGVLLAGGLDIIFSPARPTMHLESTTNVGGTTVYDHSRFSVTLKNGYRKPVSIQSVHFISIGNVEKSGLGDIVSYWPWKGSRTLQPGKVITLDRVWGFTVDTPNTEMTYRFEVNFTVSGQGEQKQVVKELELSPTR